jgi:hypothetical protein
MPNLPRRSSSPGSVCSRRTALPVCVPRAFSNTAGRVHRAAPDRGADFHHIWSTLNSRLASNRNGLENFVTTVIRRAALELEDYALAASPEDNIDDFLAWVKRREAARTSGNASYFVIVSEGLFFNNSESSVTLDQNAT